MNNFIFFCFILQIVGIVSGVVDIKLGISGITKRKLFNLNPDKKGGRFVAVIGFILILAGLLAIFLPAVILASVIIY